MPARSSTDVLESTRLRSVMMQEIECAENLLDVLGREERFLKERDIEGITSTASEKARLVARMEELGGQRLNMTTCSLEPKNSASMDSLDTRGSQELSIMWRQLRGLLDRCHTQNQINGHAIQTITKYVERTVQILQGVSDAPSVYGADGEALALTATRYVARA